MGIRNIKRQIARNRLAAMGVGNVNKKMRHYRRDTDGKPLEQPLWKRVLSGDLAKKGFAAQMGKKIRSARRVRRITP